MLCKTPRPLRIAVQGRERFFRRSCELILDDEPDMAVVATAATGRELLICTAGQRLDVVLVELDVSAWDPIPVITALQERHAGVTVIGTVAGTHPWLTARAHTAGVRTVVGRDCDIDDLLESIRLLPETEPSEAYDRVVLLDERRSALARQERRLTGDMMAEVVELPQRRPTLRLV